MEAILFYVFAIGVLVAGAQVIFRRNPIYGALSLVGCFFFLAGIYVLLSAPLIAILQIMIYAGAVMVLFVFVIMLLNLKEEELGEQTMTFWKGAGVAAVIVATGLIASRALGPAYPGAPPIDNAVRMAGAGFGGVKAVGRTLYLASVLPFEVTSLLLLVAVVAAVVIAKGEDLMLEFFHQNQAQHYLVLGALLFALGAAGVVLRRNAIIVLMSIELMLNAVNLTFLAFARFPLVPNSPMGSFLHGHTAVFFVIATAAAEAAVGLAIIIAVFRSRTSINVDEFDVLKL